MVVIIKYLMFLFEKYKPTNINNFSFNKDIMEQLVHIASNENIPHIIISGPSGAGKKTIVNFLLESLYDSDVNDTVKRKYNITGSSSKKEIEIMQSNYHIVIEPTNTNHDKYMLQEIIKQYAMHKQFNIFKTNRKFKTIVIYNIDNLANNSQAALRRTMEIFAKTCRFIMVCNNLSKIFEPLRSRCRTFCVPLPSNSDIFNVISHIAIMENIHLSNDEREKIINTSNNNIKKAIWMLELKRMNNNVVMTLDEIFDNVIDLIISCTTAANIVEIFEKKIRNHIYNILITNIKGSEIITTLVNLLINKIKDDKINIEIIQVASEAEYNLIHGRRDIIHIDFFICSIMKILRNHMPKNNTSKGNVLKTNVDSYLEKIGHDKYFATKKMALKKKSSKKNIVQKK